MSSLLACILLCISWANAHAQTFDTTYKYHANGTVGLGRISFQNGNTRTETYYWKNGNIQRQHHYSLGGALLTSKHCRKNGQLLSSYSTNHLGTICIRKYYPSGQLQQIGKRGNGKYKELLFYENGQLQQKIRYRNGSLVYCFAQDAQDTPSCWCHNEQVYWQDEHYENAFGEEGNTRFVFKSKHYYPNGQLTLQIKQKGRRKRVARWDGSGTKLQSGIVSIRVKPVLPSNSLPTTLTLESSKDLVGSYFLYDTPNQPHDTLIQTWRIVQHSASSIKCRLQNAFYDSFGRQSMEFVDLSAKRQANTLKLDCTFVCYQNRQVWVGISANAHALALIP